MDTALYDERMARNSEPAPAADGGWAESLVRAEPDADVHALVRKAGSGLGLAALYGLALGVRQGGAALLEHTLGVPLALLLVAVIGTPSMFVFLSLSRAKVDGRAVVSAMARGVGSAGVLLAGLAPAAALFLVTSETPQAARFVVIFGLMIGGGVALGRTLRDILQPGWDDRSISAVATACIAGGFAMFAILFAVRIWTAVLPVLGAAS